MVDHQQMIAQHVVGVCIKPGQARVTLGRRAHLIIEHREAQRLRGPDLGGTFRKAHFKPSLGQGGEGQDGRMGIASQYQSLGAGR